MHFSAGSVYLSDILLSNGVKFITSEIGRLSVVQTASEYDSYGRRVQGERCKLEIRFLANSINLENSDTGQLVFNVSIDSTEKEKLEENFSYFYDITH